MALLRCVLAVVASALLLLASAQAQTAPAPALPSAKLKVAVADFEVRGGAADLGKNLADAFGAPLFQTKRFELYDRRQTVALLNEVRFTQLGVTEQAQQLQSRNIDVLVTGTINVNSASSLRVDVQFTNVRTAQVQFADSVEGRGPQDFPSVAARLVDALTKEFPLQGVVLAPDARAANRYYISVGSGSNVTVGVTGRFFQMQVIGPSRFVPVEAGTFKVVELSLDPTVSIVEVVTAVAGYKPKDGDAVTISLGGSTPPPAPDPPPVRTGGATVRSSVAGATVLVDGQARGVIANAGGTLTVQGLSPGQHTLTVRADGFEESTQTFTVASDAATPIEVSLKARAVTPPPGQSLAWPLMNALQVGQVWTVTVDSLNPWVVTLSRRDSDGSWQGMADVGPNLGVALVQYDPSTDTLSYAVGDNYGVAVCAFVGASSLRGTTLVGKAYALDQSNDDAEVVDLGLGCTVKLGR